MLSSTFRRNLVFVAGWVLAGVGVALLANHLWPGGTPPVAPDAAPQASAAQTVRTSHEVSAPAADTEAAPSLPQAAPALASPADLDSLLPQSGTYSSAVRRSAPAVVSVYAQTKETVAYQRRRAANGQIVDVPVVEPRLGLGSGVIVDAQGHIVTNDHVVKGAYEIAVQLADGRSAAARVVGTDPGTDLAVLKIELPRLPVMPLGRADRIAVGDVVLAIGNPLGLTQTVTHGIVSATRRADLGIARYEEFIQTDAAINKGNSGGALVNARGELIGINTAVIKEESAEGLGMAIPVDLVRGVMQEILRNGRVARGWIGLKLIDISDENARRSNMPYSGVLIYELHPESPALRAGLAVNDKIEAIDGQVATSGRNALGSIATHKPGSTVKITGIRARDNQRFSVEVQVIEPPPGSQKP